jgi:hypothetical protein
MKKRSLIIAFLTVVVILLLTGETFGYSFTPTLTPSSTVVPESTEFTVTVKISNIDAGQYGINSLSGHLSFDTKVFDGITDTSIDGLNSWKVSYNADSGKVTAIKNGFVTSEEEVFQVTFRTKAGTSGQKGTINYKNILASNSETDISAIDISTTITVNNNPQGNSTNTNTQTPIVINPTNNTPSTNIHTNTQPTNIQPLPVNTNTNTNRTNTNPPANTNTAQGEAPYTGAEDVVVRVIFVVLVIAAISYFKYQSLNDDK